MSKKHPHILKIILSVVIIAVLAVMVAIILSIAGIFGGLFDPDVPNGFNSEIVETHDVADFFDKTYLKYNGGKDAEIFFNEYAYLDDYKDIAFYYKDNEKAHYIAYQDRYQRTIFVLDVYYDEETFWKISERIILEIEGKSAEEAFLLHDGTHRGYLSGYKIQKDNDIYQNNNASVFFDPRYHTIRYAFLCNDTTENTYAVDLVIEYVLNLSENHDEEDWIFDYSDIVTAIPKDTTEDDIGN